MSSLAKSAVGSKHKVDPRQALMVARTKLSHAGFRITKPRLEVLKVLINAIRPLTVAEIFSEVQRRTSMDRVSTYRVVEVLEEQELIHPVGNARFVFCSHLQDQLDHHLYLICRLCAAISEVELPPKLESLISAHLQKQSKFKSHGQIQVYGQCETCS